MITCSLIAPSRAITVVSIMRLHSCPHSLGHSITHSVTTVLTYTTRKLAQVITHLPCRPIREVYSSNPSSSTVILTEASRGSQQSLRENTSIVSQAPTSLTHIFAIYSVMSVRFITGITQFRIIIATIC